ncbi:MAG: VanZ family protein [Gammaproteobacteria bacterium]
MRALRFGYWWLGGGLVLLAYVLYATLAPRVPGGSIVDDKLAHFLAFAALMAWFSGVFRPGTLPLVALCLAVLGVGIELAQGQLTYRSAEVADALYDFAGILIAWALASAGLGQWAEQLESRMLRQDS